MKAKNLFSFFLSVLMLLPQTGCIAILAAGAGAGAMHMYSKSHRKCPYCQKQISTEASICPKCRHEVEPTKKRETPYRETAFGKVVCVHCDELIDTKATVCPHCTRNVEPLKPGEITRDRVTKKIKCVHCKKMIPEKATVCPECQKNPTS